MKARHQKCGNDSVDLSDLKGKPAPASLWFSHLYPDGSSSSGEKTNHTLLLIALSVAQRKQSRHVLFLFLVYLLFLPNDQEREENTVLFGFWHVPLLHCEWCKKEFLTQRLACLTCTWMLFMFPFNTSNGCQPHLSWVLHTCGDLTVGPDNMNNIPKLRPTDGHGSPLFTLYQLSSLFLTPQVLKV